ncbi:AzlD domain-containing protein [Ruania alba]|uniref:Branched-chain amino acid transport protein (AzlD) n=1 Tax=Ruania alba TaxID=648782 RepID=A0A1H5M0E3_9MICO|nr:AzlD domain-containing protein [Ruania alba]SEE82712.1 Branched-chain amino acid transport protein (AzlD) [Ruania alba]
MPELWTILLAGLGLALGTFAIRASGGAAGGLLESRPRVQQLMEDGAVLVLASVMATTALTDGAAFAGWARPAGVALAGVLAWRGVPLPAVLVVAAASTAGLRALGVE